MPLNLPAAATQKHALHCSRQDGVHGWLFYHPAFTTCLGDLAAGASGATAGAVEAR